MEKQHFILQGELKAMADRWVTEVFEPIVAERGRIVHEVFGCEKFVHAPSFHGGKVLLGVVSEVPIAGMRKVTDNSNNQYYAPDLRTKLGKAHKTLFDSVRLPVTALPVLEELGLAGKDCFEGNVVAWSQVFKPHDDWILSVPGPLVSIAILDHPDLVLAVEGFRPMAEVI
jgi:hypothetical protein